jgi:hypothetical protein
MGKIYLVQIKSDSIEREGKKALLIPMSFENEENKRVKKEDIHQALIRDARLLYPDYTKTEDNVIITISTITQKEFSEWKKTNIIKQKSFSRKVV